MNCIDRQQPNSIQLDGMMATHIIWETRLKWTDTLQGLNLLLGQFDLQRLNIILQMLDFATADNREDL